MAEIGFFNTGLPLLVLGALAVLLPNLLLPSASLSHRDAALAVLASALILLVIGAIGYAGLAVLRGFDLWAALATSGFALIRLLLYRSALAALVWGPLLGLTWLSLALRLNRARGRELARREP